MNNYSDIEVYDPYAGLQQVLTSFVLKTDLEPGTETYEMPGQVDPHGANMLSYNPEKQTVMFHDEAGNVRTHPKQLLQG